MRLVYTECMNDISYLHKNLILFVFCYQHNVLLIELRIKCALNRDVTGGGGSTHMLEVYRDVMPKWVGFFTRNPKHRSHLLQKYP